MTNGNKDLLTNSKTSSDDRNSVAITVEDNSRVVEVECSDFSEDFSIKSMEANVSSPEFSTAMPLGKQF